MRIGVAGTNGSGKGAVIDYLVGTKGFSRYSARALILEEVRARHLPETRASMREVANDLRRERGASYIVEQLCTMAKDDTNAVIESLRAVGEVEYLKAQRIFLIGVDAEQRIRYERVARQDDELAHMSFEDFQAMEEHERSATEEWDMNVFEVVKRADVCIINNGLLEEVHAAVDQALVQIESAPAV